MSPTSSPLLAAVSSPRIPGRWTDTGWRLLPLADVLVVAVAGLLSLALFRSLDLTTGGTEMTRLIWVAAVLAPFLLDDRGAARREGRHGFGRIRAPLLGRSALLLLVMAALLHAGNWWSEAPSAWLALWATSALGLVALARWVLMRAQTHAPEEPVSKAAVPLWIAEAIPATLLADRPIRRWSAVFKQAKDFSLAALLLLLLSPLLAVIALAIRLDSPGPLLFRQRRHGLNNAEFEILKFRTMRVSTQAPGAGLQQTRRVDARVTRVGGFLRKWSLDELPQLINVLNGSMSLVGPRPHAVDMRTEAQLGVEITAVYPHRHRVRPGITGWSQVNGARGATETTEQLRRRIELDLYYVDHWSLLLDVKILTLTSRAVLKATNAF